MTYKIKLQTPYIIIKSKENTKIKNKKNHNKTSPDDSDLFMHWQGQSIEHTKYMNMCPNEDNNMPNYFLKKNTRFFSYDTQNKSEN